MTELQMIVTQKADQLDLIDVNKMLETLAQRKNYLEMVKHFIQFELFTLLFNFNKRVIILSFMLIYYLNLN